MDKFPKCKMKSDKDSTTINVALQKTPNAYDIKEHKWKMKATDHVFTPAHTLEIEVITCTTNHLSEFPLDTSTVSTELQLSELDTKLDLDLIKVHIAMDAKNIDYNVGLNSTPVTEDIARIIAPEPSCALPKCKMKLLVDKDSTTINVALQKTSNAYDIKEHKWKMKATDNASCTKNHLSERFPLDITVKHKSINTLSQKNFKLSLV